MNNLWASLSEAQATVLATGLTVAGTLLGLFIGWLLFAGRLGRLEAAVARTEKGVGEQRDAMRTRVDEALKGLDVQVSAIAEKLAQVQESVSDVQAEPLAAAEAPQTVADWSWWYVHQERWHCIRDRLEALASDPELDGHIRARYQRIDRRRFGELIDAMDRDNRLGVHGGRYREALRLWQVYKNGRVLPTESEQHRMSELAMLLGERR